MRVSIIGAGYVGLVTGACLAAKGHAVQCVDVDSARVDMINRAAAPIFEPGLEDLLRETVPTRLTATTDLSSAVRNGELTMIAVGTPFEGSKIDLRFVREATRAIGEALRQKTGYHVVVVKSTVVPGTTDEVVLPILEQGSGKKAGLDFGVGMNPEFLTEGEAVHDFMFPDRIVLGGLDEKSTRVMEELYSGFPGVERLRCKPKTAEMIKYASNSLLATMISFSNEIGNLCAALGGLDVVEVMEGLHLSRYLTTVLPDGRRVVPPINSFLWPGCGFGGSCLPKDVKALVAHGKAAGQGMPLLESVIRVNEGQPREILRLLKKHYPQLEGVRVTVLGLAFRPDTSDIRESPAIPIIKDLLREGASVSAYDPAALDEARKVFRNGRLRLCPNLADAVQEAQAIVMVTSWGEFRGLPQILSRLPVQPLFIDGRRMLDPREIARYEGIGR